MKIREFRPEDLDQLLTLAKQHNLLLPSNGMVNVAEDKNGLITGMMMIRLVPTIEPFICTNPLTAKKLFETTMNQVGETMKDMNIMRAFIKPELLPQFQKFGFYKVFENNIIIERNI